MYILRKHGIFFVNYCAQTSNEETVVTIEIEDLLIFMYKKYSSQLHCNLLTLSGGLERELNAALALTAKLPGDKASSEISTSSLERYED